MARFVEFQIFFDPSSQFTNILSKNSFLDKDLNRRSKRHGNIIIINKLAKRVKENLKFMLLISTTKGKLLNMFVPICALKSPIKNFT